jgi:hypothetical protein
MKPYTVLEFIVSPANGSVNIKAEWELNDGLKTEAPEFHNEERANNYIRSAKKTWILKALELWVKHKKAIINGGADATNLAKQQALMEAEKSLRLLQNWPLNITCEQILKGEPVYRTLLPSVNNPSFESSAEKLSIITDFATKNQSYHVHQSL